MTPKSNDSIKKTYDLLKDWGCLDNLTVSEQNAIQYHLEHIKNDAIDDFKDKIMKI